MSVRVAYRQWLSVARLAATMLAAWPRVVDSIQTAASGAHAQRCRTPNLNPKPHSYVWNGKCWVCRVCSRYKYKVSSPLDAFPCVEIPQIFKTIRDSLPETQHDVRVTQILEDGPFGAFCVRCGFFAFHRPMGLLGPCKRSVKSKGTSYRLGRMRRGLHPLDRRCIATPWRMASDLGTIQQVVPTQAPNTVATSLPPSIVGPSQPTPVNNWNVEFPGGFDIFSMEDESEE